MARTRTEYGPPTSRPCTRNSPVARVRVLLAYPVLRFTTSTSTSARGCPCWSVTLPVTAPVVTPCAPTTSATSTANAAAAARARDERTIQCMVGSLLLEDWLGERLLSRSEKLVRDRDRVKHAGARYVGVFRSR